MNEIDEKLMEYAFEGNLEKVKECVAQGGYIRVQEDYALRCSAEGGHLDIVKYCMEQGGNIRAENDEELRHSDWNRHEECSNWIAKKINEMRGNDE